MIKQGHKNNRQLPCFITEKKKHSFLMSVSFLCVTAFTGTNVKRLNEILYQIKIYVTVYKIHLYQTIWYFFIQCCSLDPNTVLIPPAQHHKPHPLPQINSFLLSNSTHIQIHQECMD